MEEEGRSEENEEEELGVKSDWKMDSFVSYCKLLAVPLSISISFPLMSCLGFLSSIVVNCNTHYLVPLRNFARDNFPSIFRFTSVFEQFPADRREVARDL